MTTPDAETPEPGPEIDAGPTEPAAADGGTEPDPGEPTDDVEAHDQPDDDLAALIGDPEVYEAMMAEFAKDGDGESAESDDEPEPASEEAKRYRLRLRETEARLEEQGQVLGWTQDRLETVWRGEVERVAAAKLEDPKDLWLSGADIADVQNDDGDIDAAKVERLCDELIKAHPHWRIAPPNPRAGLYSGSSNRPDMPMTSKWQSAFAPPPQ